MSLRIQFIMWWVSTPFLLTEREDFEFSSRPPVITIMSGTSRGCLTITILPSDLVEGEEEIHLAINEGTTLATVEQGNTTVMIASDGGNVLLPVFNGLTQICSIVCIGKNSCCDNNRFF